MGSRMDKYNDSNINDIPSRSVKNQELYKQIYNAYDEFENLVVPSNAKEIDLSNLKKEISSRDEYKKIKDYGDITNNKVIRKEIVQEEQKKENEIYDINVLIKNAVLNNKEEVIEVNESEDYLKKLKLDDSDIANLDDDIEVDEELLKTANLSLELLSDLKGDNDNTMVEAPAIDDDYEDNDDLQFYSGQYEFSDKDFDENKEVLDEEDFDDTDNKSGVRFFLRVLLCVFGILLVGFIIFLLLKK